MPVGGEKRFYTHLVGTPTPPIVIQLAQPPKLSTMPERVVKEQQVKGIRMTIDDLQLVANDRTAGNILKFFWHLRGQWSTLLSIGGFFLPFLWLDPAQLKDMANKMNTHIKPLLDLMPRKY